MKTVLFDIDGTLALVDHRRPLLEGDRPNWTAFFKAMGEDGVNEPVATLYRTLWDNPDYEVIVLSGRPDRYRKLTEQWFIWNKLPFEKILMRASTDNRPDDQVKCDFLYELKAQGKEILFVVDDRQSVVDMWRDEGICCLQCDYGDF